MTLLELLVVISILTILLGVAIPLLSPASDSRRTREAARAINTFIQGAKTRAKETGRPFGVALKRLSQDTGRQEDNAACLELYYVEQLPPYAGLDENSRVRIALNPWNTDGDQLGRPDYMDGGVMVQFVTFAPGKDENELPAGYDYDPIPPVFRVGDVLEVGGYFFVFKNNAEIDPANGALINDGDQIDETGFYTDEVQTLTAVTLDGAQYQLIPAFDSDGLPVPNGTNLPPFWSEAMRYKIHRQPTKTSNEPLQLTKNMVIDLEGSGFGEGTRLHDPYSRDSGGNHTGPDNPSDIMVMFSPEGTISEAYFNTSYDRDGSEGASADRSLAVSNLYLLVGLRENINPEPINFDANNTFANETEKTDAKQKINWLNGDSRWVVLSSQSGAVSSVENAYVDPAQHTDQPLSGSLGDTGFDTELAKRRFREVHAAREYALRAQGMGGR